MHYWKSYLSSLHITFSVLIEIESITFPFQSTLQPPPPVSLWTSAMSPPNYSVDSLFQNELNYLDITEHTK